MPESLPQKPPKSLKLSLDFKSITDEYMPRLREIIENANQQ